MNTPSNIYSVFEKTALKTGGNPAIISLDNRVISFAELKAQAENAASNAAAAGVTKGSKVLFMSAMSQEFYIVLLGLIKLGAQVIVVDPWMKRQAVERSISAIRPGFFFGSLKAYLFFMQFKPFWGIKVRRLESSLRKNSGSRQAATAETSGEDAALITFTTGSTGIPKGIIRTKDMLLAQLSALDHAQGFGAGSVDMQPFPVFLLANLGRGAASVIPWKGSQDPDRADMDAVRAAIVRHKVDVLSASPAFLSRLIAEANPPELAGIKKIFTGGGMVTQLLAEKLAALPEKRYITAMYGSTEAEPIAHIGIKELVKIKNPEGRCAGRPVREIKVKINPAGFAKISGRQAGEILVSGRHVAGRYFDAEKGVEIKKPAWHATGDIGYFDAKRRLFLCGRVNNVLVAGGKKLPAGMLELKISGMAAAGSVALLQDHDAVCVAAERRDGKKMKSAEQAIKTELAKYGFKTVFFLFVGRIPKDPRHRTKTDYAGLRAAIGRRI